MVEEGTSFSGKRNLELDVNYTGHIFLSVCFIVAWSFRVGRVHSLWGQVHGRIPDLHT